MVGPHTAEDCCNVPENGFVVLFLILVIMICGGGAQTFNLICDDRPVVFFIMAVVVIMHFRCRLFTVELEFMYVVHNNAFHTHPSQKFTVLNDDVNQVYD